MVFSITILSTIVQVLFLLAAAAYVIICSQIRHEHRKWKQWQSVRLMVCFNVNKYSPLFLNRRLNRTLNSAYVWKARHHLKSRQTQCYWKKKNNNLFASSQTYYIQDVTVIEKSKPIKFWMRTNLRRSISFHVFSKVLSCNDESLDLSCAFIDL